MSEDNYIEIERRGCSVYIHLKYRNLNDKVEFYGFAVNCYKKVKGRLTVPVEFETWKNQINVYGTGKPTVVLDLSIRDKAVGDFGYDRLMYIYYHFDTMPIWQLYSEMIQFAIIVTNYIIKSKKARIYDKELRELLGVLEEELTVRSLYHE